jgi:site-specific recombinase XerD
MTDWYERAFKALQLAGYAETSQQGYLRAIRMLVDHTGKTPDLVGEEELQDYFLHRKNVDHWAPATMRICYSGLRFFFTKVLRREWGTFNYLGAQREKKLPSVLSQEEVRRVLAQVHTHHNRAFLTTVYACGLRLQEALHLEIGDIDSSSRMMIHVHRGKGAKDRCVPLPVVLLSILRTHWSTHRHPTLLFPASGRGQANVAHATSPMAITTVQGALRDALQRAGINKKNVSIHTLRHTYATHLLDQGVNIRLIQRYLGHANIETTMVYLHLTQRGQEDALVRINALMGDLQ